MRGIKHGPSIDIEKITDRLLNRAEYELERFSLAVGIRFDDLAAAYAHAATERFGPVLHGPQQWGVRGQVQSVRLETTEVHQVELPALEGSRHPQDSRYAPQAPTEVQGDRREKVRGRGRLKGTPNTFWSKLTPEERSKEMRRRQMVALGKIPSGRNLDEKKEKDRLRAQKYRDDARKLKAKQERAATKASSRQLGRNNKPVRSPEERAAQQKRYVERSALRAQGVPEDQLPPILKLPPLKKDQVKPKRKWVFTEARRKSLARINKTQKAKRKAPKAYAKSGGNKKHQDTYQARFAAKKWNALNPTEPPKPIPPLPSERKTAGPKSRRLTPEEHAAEQRIYAQQADAVQ